MLHNFFKQPLNNLRSDREIIKGIAWGISVAASTYYYPELTSSYSKSCMTLFYSRLCAEKKLALEKDPTMKKEFIEECKSNLRFIMGPPD